MPLLLPFIIGAAVLFALVLPSYIKAPPDVAYIITGLRKDPRVLIGQAGFRIPFFERVDKLLLKQVTIDVVTESFVPTRDFVPVRIDAVAKVKISEDLIPIAMRNFLNKTEERIIADLQDSLQGNMREIIGTMSLQEISQNREQFAQGVMEAAGCDMKALGIEIITVNIQSVQDDKGLIEALGAENAAQIMKSASISRINAEREVSIRKAEAAKESNDARVLSDKAQAERNQELAIRVAELKKHTDTKQAEADAAFRIQEEMQRKTIEQASVDADIARREREIELRMREAEVERHRAESDKVRREQEAEAAKIERIKAAEAAKIEVERETEARKLQADVVRYTQEQEAAAVRARGEAEAAAIEATGIAHAAAIEKKAEAMAKYGHAAITEMIVNVLPDVAAAVAQPLSAIDKVTVIDGGNGNAVSGISNNVPVLMRKTIESVREATGIDLVSVVNADTIDAKVNRNINVTGLPALPTAVVRELADELVTEPADQANELADDLVAIS